LRAKLIPPGLLSLVGVWGIRHFSLLGWTMDAQQLVAAPEAERLSIMPTTATASGDSSTTLNPYTQLRQLRSTTTSTDAEADGLAAPPTQSGSSSTLNPYAQRRDFVAFQGPSSEPASTSAPPMQRTSPRRTVDEMDINDEDDMLFDNDDEAPIEPEWDEEEYFHQATASESVVESSTVRPGPANSPSQIEKADLQADTSDNEDEGTVAVSLSRKRRQQLDGLHSFERYVGSDYVSHGRHPLCSILTHVDFLYNP
jgi:hypothetical protein